MSRADTLETHLTFARLALAEVEKYVGALEDTPRAAVSWHFRTLWISRAIRWRETARHNLAQAEAMLERSRTLKPLRARSVAKGGRA